MTAEEMVARVIHDEHAKYIEGAAPFERCPDRSRELRIAAAIIEALKGWPVLVRVP